MDDSQYSQNKKARAARRWRATNTLKKRFDGPLKEYIKIKYSEIYDEYSELYQRLDKRYPNVRDLSRTPMFRKRVRGVHKQLETPSSDEEEMPGQFHEAVHQQESQHKQLESQQTPSSDEGEMSGQFHEAVHQQESQHKQLESQQTPSSDAGQMPGQFYEAAHQQESQLDILSLAIKENLSEPVPSSVMQEILPEGIPNQVSDSLREFLPEISNDNENIQDIIDELEQNEAVRNILNPLVDEMVDRYNAQITPDDDEGIELNFIDEIDLQPFDFDLEVDF